jgi:cell division protein DivIC
MARKRRSREFKNSQVIDIDKAREERRKKRAEASLKRPKKVDREKGEPSKRRMAKRNRKRWVYGLIILVITFLIGMAFFRLISLKIEESRAESDLAALQKEKQELEEELSHVYSKEYIEQQARAELRMIFPGEILYVLKDGEEHGAEN